MLVRSLSYLLYVLYVRIIHTIHTKGKINGQERCLFCTLIFERFSYRSEVGFLVDSGYLWRCSENGGFLVWIVRSKNYIREHSRFDECGSVA